MKDGVGVELHVSDFAPARDFYGAVGFEVVWENNSAGKAGYMVMSMGDVVLRFWSGNESSETHSYFSKFPNDTTRGYGVEIVIAVTDLDDVFARVQGLGATVTKVIRRPWGVRDFRAVDPSGYYLRFTEPHDVTASDYGGRVS